MKTKKNVYVERGYQAQRKDSPDFQCFDVSNRLISTVHFSKSQDGGVVSFLVAKWSPISNEWINSRRLKVVLALEMGWQSEGENKEDLTQVSEAWETVRKLAKNLEIELPIESFARFPESYRRWIWRFNHRYTKTNHKDFVESIGVNRLTVLDYLNLQALGCKDYRSIIAKEVNAKPLAIRDRIAYARRHGWIDSVKHGMRTPEMNKAKNK